MEQELVTSPNNINQTNPLQQQPSTTRKKRVFLLLGIAVIFILIIVVGSIFYFFSNHKTNNSLQQPTITNTNQARKTYTNNFYNFKLDIPSNWTIEEKVIKDKKYVDGQHQIFKLSSLDGELTIDNWSMFDKNNHIKESLANTKVQLGKYTVDRYPFINDDNQRIDYIQLYNVYRQDAVTFVFNFKGNLEKNNELLLKVLKTFRYTNPMPNLEDEISYTVPKGWTKSNPDTNEWLDFQSADYTVEPVGGSILTGAEIFVEKTKKDPSKTLTQQVSTESSFEASKIATSSATFNSMSFINIRFACNGKFGFCAETYSTENKGSVWTISISCGNDCETKGGLDNTIYTKDLYTFINSIKFK